MIKALMEAFGNEIMQCVVETDSTLIEVYDDYDCIPANQRCYIITEEKEPVHFKLNNPNSANLVFIAIDNCLFKSTDLSRCDFGIGNFDKLYFVEIKQAKTNQRSEAKTKAIQQLASSISVFKEKIAVSNTKLIAVICLMVKETHPIRTASMVQKIVAFKEKHNASLMEGHSDIF